MNNKTRGEDCMSIGASGCGLCFPLLRVFGLKLNFQGAGFSLGQGVGPLFLGQSYSHFQMSVLMSVFPILLQTGILGQ